MTKVKICGLTCPEDVEAVNRYKPDYAGFVFADGRHRLSLEDAKLLVDALEKPTVSVGVFVNLRVELTAAIAEHCGLGAVQLHGSEDETYMSRLYELLPPGILVIKAVHVKDAASLAKAESIRCDMLLLDAWHETQLGGAGKAFDWRLLEGFRRPYMLAGGLNTENVVQAISILDPWGVDVSSGVETDGHKGAAKIEEFIRLVRSTGI